MNWLAALWLAFKRERNRQRRWKQRTCYTWERLPPPSPDTDRTRNIGSWT